MAKQKPKSNMALNKTAVTPAVGGDVLENIRVTHNDISQKTTNPLYVQQRPGKGGKNFDFVDEGYMRQVLNDNFPVWNWEIVKYEFIGKEAVAVHGKLTIVDNGMPRSYEALAAHDITISSKDGGYVDLGNDMKSANTEAFKVACNRLCNIADDVYRKSVLTDAQLDTLEGELGMLDRVTRTKVKQSIGNHQINPATFESTMEHLKKRKGENNG
jgi:hypothetical protein